MSAPRRRGGSAGDAAPGSGGSRGSGFEGGAVRGLGRALSWTAAVLALARVARGMRLKKRRPSFFQPRGGGGGGVRVSRPPSDLSFLQPHGVAAAARLLAAGAQHLPAAAGAGGLRAGLRGLRLPPGAPRRHPPAGKRPGGTGRGQGMG